MLSTVRRSNNFNKGLALSVSLPNVLHVAKNINRTVRFCFTCLLVLLVLLVAPATITPDWS